MSWSEPAPQRRPKKPRQSGTANQPAEPTPNRSEDKGPRPSEAPPNRKVARARAYLREIEGAISGERGHDQTFKAACCVGPGFDLDPEDALYLLVEDFNPRCEPPWSKAELRHKVEHAYRANENRLGWLLDEKRAEDTETAADAELERFDDPHRMARRFLKRHRHTDGETIVYHRGTWYEWDHRAWRETPEIEIQARLNRHIREEMLAEAVRLRDRGKGRKRGNGKDGRVRAKPVTARSVNDAIQALRSQALLQEMARSTPPMWIGESRPSWRPEDVLPLRNALVHLPGWVADNPESVRPPSPGFFCTYALDFDFEPQASHPDHWLRFLDDIWGEDGQAIETLQEWMGYLLTPETRHHKILMLIGPTRSGKGTILHVMKELIGPANVVSPTLSSLSANFGLAPLIGKPLASIADARLSGRSDSAAVVERLLSISGGDPQTIDRKHREAWSGSLPTKFVLATNELPRLPDTSGALVSRFILLSVCSKIGIRT